MRSRRVAPRWACFAFIAMGIYIVLLSMGVIPHVPSGRRRALLLSPHHWQVTAIGISFIASGAAMAFRRAPQPWRIFVSATAAAGFLAPLAWMVWASPLPRHERILLGVVVGAGVALTLAISAYQRLTGRLFDPTALDPLEAARILRMHGRHEQAEAVLQRAIRDEPSRQDEFERAIQVARRRAQKETPT